MLTVGHVLFKGFSVCIKFVNSIQEFFISDLFFFKNHTVSLFFKGTGIQNLITSAGIGRKWDQKVGFMKGAEFADRVGTCSGDYDIGQCEKIRKFLFDVFVLYIAFGSLKRFIHFALTAEMDYLEVFQKFRKDLANVFIYRCCTQASADNEQYWFIFCEIAETSACFFVTGK